MALKQQNVLIIGGGIGGLTAAIALGARGHKLTVIEKDPDWAVYGVGIIQQANVVRAMAGLGIIDDYLAAGFGFDWIEAFLPSGEKVARIPAPRLVEGIPANVGISRRSLHNVLAARAKAAGAEVRLGLTVSSMDDGVHKVVVQFSNGETGEYDLVIGADGLYSTTRKQIFPDAPAPEFTGQSVWRYNFPRDPETDCIQFYEGKTGVGLVPLAADLMYMFVTTPEAGNPRFPVEGLAARMQARISQCSSRIQELGEQITVDSEVVYKPLEWIFLQGDWHKGRVVLLGDAVHATTPHLGQGAGMAIEDAVVLAEELDREDTLADAFAAYQTRRFERCRYIVEESLKICRGQLGEGPLQDTSVASAAMYEVISQPI